ncbi:unnamed protein product [Miscanthus lutarioriparius]|uniref:DUF4220 domain-containing protein n=1 Tax=Miscanthus lutarioriparius TaxID=422564 RepID=A0A811NIC7_9POAL|nr:unnamed protein product [Miscanthus lutarioriparius]
MGRCRCFPVALRKLIGLEPEDDDDDNVVERPEELINHYVRLMTATANITSGLGTLALLWSTVVLLGGFVAVLGMKDFWTLTLLSFLLACRVVDNYDKEFKRGIYTEEAKIMNFRKWIDEALAMCQRIMLGMALLPKYILLCCLALLSFNVAPFVSLGISVRRLVRRDYGDAGGDVANRAKLNAALDIFYALVLLQSLFVLYWVTLESASGDDDHRWGARILDKLISGKDKSVRQELLSSRLSIQNLMGMIGRRRGAADGDMENRERTTTIVAHLASDLHITSFPGTLQCICSLLESTSSCDCEPKLHACPSGNPDEQATLPTDENDHQHGSLETSEHQDDGTHMDMVAPTITDQTDEERQAVVVSSSSSGLAAKRKTKQIKKDLEDIPIIRVLQLGKELKKYSESKYRRSYKSRGAKELISQGLLILERLTQDQGNCTEISKDQRLLSKITSPLMRSASHGDFLTKLSDNTTVEMLSKSLTVLSRLLTGPGDDVTRLHQKLASNTEAVSNLMGILENDSEGAQKLHEQALEILTELAFDDSFKELDFNKLFKALLRIFLEKETNNITKQEPNNNATSQVEQADTERAPKLRGNAGEALARLLPVRAARGIISKQEAIDLLNKVLHKILSSKMGTTADAVEIVVENQPQEDADTDSVQPPIQENEKQSEERKFMAAMLSLAVVICNENMISKEDFACATATPRDGAVAKKLKEILQVNKQSTAQCLRIVKLTCQVVIVMIEVKPSCIAHFNEHNFKGTLAEALETMSEVDDCMLFAGNECEVIKPARSLTSLVKEAHELLKTAQEQGNCEWGEELRKHDCEQFPGQTKQRYVQLHMKSEHTKSTNYNPVTLHGYKYPFYEDYYDHEDAIITLDRIWCSNEGPLGTSDGQQLKEACLSFSLFRLLWRRFFGLACPEAKPKIKKTCHLVFKGLLRAEENYEAAYRVIEAELAFAHDHFFTSCASFY